jgi:hypothetical protein
VYSTLIVLAAGCGSSSSSTSGNDQAPDEFMKTLIGYSFRGQYGRVYDLLHPGQKQLVSREAFQDCNQGDGTDVELDSIKTVEIYDDPVDVPGIPQRTSKAVTLKIKVRQGDATESVTRTSHAVRVDERWAWIFGPSDIDTYRQGECPT